MGSSKSALNRIPDEGLTLVSPVGIESGKVLKLDLTLAPARGPPTRSMVPGINPEWALNPFFAVILKKQSLVRVERYFSVS